MNILITYSVCLLLFVLTVTPSTSIPVPTESAAVDLKWLVEIIQNYTKDGLFQLPAEMISMVPLPLAQFANNKNQPRIPDFILKNTGLLTQVVTNILEQKGIPIKSGHDRTTSKHVETSTTPVTPARTSETPIRNTPTTTNPIVVEQSVFTEELKDISSNQIDDLGSNQIPTILHTSDAVSIIKNYFAPNADSELNDANSNPQYGFAFFQQLRNKIKNGVLFSSNSSIGQTEDFNRAPVPARPEEKMSKLSRNEVAENSSKVTSNYTFAPSKFSTQRRIPFPLSPMNGTQPQFPHGVLPVIPINNLPFANLPPANKPLPNNFPGSPQVPNQNFFQFPPFFPFPLNFSQFPIQAMNGTKFPFPCLKPAGNGGFVIC